MLIEAVIGGALVTAGAVKSIHIDEKSLETLRDAHNLHAEAVELVRRSREKADQNLQKLVNRKKAILSNRLLPFVELFDTIRRIEFAPGEGIVELLGDQITVEDAVAIRTMAISSMKPMSDNEVAVKFLFSGITGVMVADSKRRLSIANSQMQIAETTNLQAEEMAIAMNAIGEHAELISDLLARFSFLLGKTLNEMKKIIDCNGMDRSLYTKEDREVIMACVNIAGAVKAVLDAPILDGTGSISQESQKALREGTQRLEKLKSI